MTPDQGKGFIDRAFAQAEIYLRGASRSQQTKKERLDYGLGLCSGIHSSLLAIVPSGYGQEWDRCFKYFDKKRDALLDKCYPGANPDVSLKREEAVKLP